jgi:hypothetical protein
MSAYVVEDSTINAIVSYLCNHDPNSNWLKQLGYNLFNQDDQKRLARDMFNMNVEAVCQRYPDDNRDSYQFAGFEFELSRGAVAIYKTIHCYLYQCSEGSVPTFELYQALDKIAGTIGYQIIAEMPEYESAPWG